MWLTPYIFEDRKVFIICINLCWISWYIFILHTVWALINVCVSVTENYYSLVKSRREQEAEQIRHGEVLIDQVRRKNEQAEVARAHMLATRKVLMLGRTANQSLAEQRRRVSRRNWFLHDLFILSPTDRCVEALCFRVSVRECVLPCVRPGVSPAVLARYLTNQWTGFHQILADDIVQGTDELIRFRISRDQTQSQH